MKTSKLLKTSIFTMLTIAIVSGSSVVFAEKPLTETKKVTAREKATFAGGCFWCMEPPFDKVEGVISTVVGYTDGHKVNPGYKAVSAGTTGHTEAIQIEYDPTKVSYSELLEIFWKNIDPIAKDRQFCDGGTQYRSGIYFHDETQADLAKASAEKLTISRKFVQPIATEIKKASIFYPAEDYHQDYYKKNPIRYKFYRQGCGRDRRLKEIWGE